MTNNMIKRKDLTRIGTDYAYEDFGLCRKLFFKLERVPMLSLPDDLINEIRKKEDEEDELEQIRIRNRTSRYISELEK